MAYFSPLLRVVVDALPGIYLAALAGLLCWALRRWFDPVPARILVVYAVAIGLLFAPILVGGKVLLPLDNLRGSAPFLRNVPTVPAGSDLQGTLLIRGAPAQAQVRRALKDGRWPMWNPHGGAGLSLLGDPMAQPFEPALLATLPLPLSRAFGVAAAWRILVCLVFCYLWMRRCRLSEGAALCGSLAFGLGGFSLFWMGWPRGAVASALPVLLYALARCGRHSGRHSGRRDLTLLGLATASLLLAGDARAAAGALLLGAAYGAFLLRQKRPEERGRRALAWILTGVLAAAVVSPVWWARMRAEERSFPHRLVEGGADRRMSEDPLGLVSLRDLDGWKVWAEGAGARLLPWIAPRALADGLPGAYRGLAELAQGASGFVGSAGLLLALFALGAGRRGRRRPEVVFFGAVAVGAALILARPPPLEQCLDRLPFFGPSADGLHAALLWSLSLAYLAAVGVESLRADIASGRRLRRRLAGLAIGLAGAILLAHGLSGGSSEAGGLWGVWQVAAIGIAGSAAFWPRSARAPGLATAIGLELFCFGGEAIRPMPPHLFYPTPKPLEFLQARAREEPSARIIGHASALLPEVAAIYDLRDAQLAGGRWPYAMYLLLQPLLDLPDDERPVNHPLLDLLGVRHVLSPPGLALPEPLALRFEDVDGWVYERPTALSLVFLPRSAESFRGGDWPSWVHGRSDFAERALMQRLPAGVAQWQQREPPPEVSLQVREVGWLEGRVVLAEDRPLASGLYQDGGWSLLVDGRAHPWMLSNGPLFGAWLGAGDRELTLLYRSPGLLLAALAAALALAAISSLGLPAPGPRGRAEGPR